MPALKRPLTPIRSAAEAMEILRELRANARDERVHLFTRLIEWLKTREREREDIEHGAVALLADAAQRVGEAQRIRRRPTLPG